MHRESQQVTGPGLLKDAERTSELRYRRLFESAKDGILIVDASTARISDINPYLTELLGYSRAELLGRKLCDSGLFDETEIDGALRELHDKHYLRHDDLPLKTKAGRRIDVELVCNLHHEGSETVIQCNIRDISDRKRADNLLIGQNRVLEMLATGEALHDVLATLIRVIEEQSEGIFGSILVCRQDSDCFYTGVAPSLPARYLQALQQAPLSPPYLGPCAMAAHSGKAVATNEIATDRRWSEEWRTLVLGLDLHSCYSSPVFAANGKALGSFGIYQRNGYHAHPPAPQLLEAATHLAGIAIERRQVETALRESDQRKDEFLATLSHELRNPLASIRNAVQLLRLTVEGDSSAARSTSVLERQVGQMVRLVDDLLEVSRISQAKVKLNKERVELASVVQQAIEATNTLVQCRRHELTVTLPSEPIYLDGDPCRLSQVVGNLLDNACKYTDDGGQIWLTLECRGEQAVLSVRDTGVGINADQFQHIFEMFTQIDTPLERSQSGLGIGLTLVKNLVELHAGTVEVQSAGDGRGTEFIVRLPIVECRAATQPAPGQQTTTDVRRILIVDDDRDAATTLAMLLALGGHETQTVHEGVQTVEAAEGFVPDVILLDIGMPKMDGYAVARTIRKQPWGSKPVLIALTGWGQDEDRRKSKEAGFDGHLVKPADYTTLTRLIAELSTA